MNPKERRIRLDKIAYALGRYHLWGEEQFLAYLDNGLSDLEYMKGYYGSTNN